MTVSRKSGRTFATDALMNVLPPLKGQTGIESALLIPILTKNEPEMVDRAFPSVEKEAKWPDGIGTAPEEVIEPPNFKGAFRCLPMSNESISEIARQYCVSDIPGATIPGSRLSSILESMFHGRPLSGLSLKYLEQQHLTELHLLATGQIDYEAFIEASTKARKSR